MTGISSLPPDTAEASRCGPHPDSLVQMNGKPSTLHMIEDRRHQVWNVLDALLCSNFLILESP